MKGRKPKAAEVHERNGNPSHLAKDEKMPTTVAGRGLPARPSGLNADARNAWDTLCELLVDVLDKADGPALEELAVMIGRARQARRELNKRGTSLVIEGARGPTKNPWLGIEADAWKEARQLFEHFGIGPTGRARLGMGQKGGGGKSPQKEMEDLVGGSRGRRGLHAVEGGKGA